MKFANLKKIKVTTHSNSITDGQISELQTALSILGYPVGQIDGLIGPKTKDRFAVAREDTLMIDISHRLLHFNCLNIIKSLRLKI